MKKKTTNILFFYSQNIPARFCNQRSIRPRSQSFLPHLWLFFLPTDSSKPVINGYPWGSKDAWNSDPYHNAPETGVVRSYDFTIARGTVAPDGFERSSLLINGQFPGVRLNKSLQISPPLTRNGVAHDRSQLGRHHSGDCS